MARTDIWSAPSFIMVKMDNQLTVTLKDVREACEAVSAVPMPVGETAEVRNEAVMDVYTLLEQLAMERAAAPK